MPINFIELRTQIHDMGSRAKNQYDRHKKLLDEAKMLLKSYANQSAVLGQRVDAAAQANPRLRCAKPTDETLTLGFSPQPNSTQPVLLAADGSQINPSRHDPFPFCVINVGAFLLHPSGSTPDAPQEFTRTTLLFFDDVITPQGLMSEGIVALRRDLYERQMLAELARGKPMPVLALTDGPLELFFESGESEEFRKSLQQYLDALHQMEKLGVIAAGYVDKPYADLVVRMLELTLLGENELSQAGRKRPLLGARDEQLYKEILEPGQRSAIFRIQSQQCSYFKDALAIHFFYLNIGRTGHPAIARVEIPAWVADDTNLLSILHSTLVVQCSQMAGHPYPYVLHRAHEIALVSFDEKKKILDMIALEHLQRGLEIGETSHKQASKDLSTKRTRYP